MPDPPPEDRDVNGLAAGDPQSYREFWKQYGPRLQRLAERRLPAGLQQRIGPEDVVQSVCRTFFRRMTEGQLQVTEAESLWHLLSVITVNKVKMYTRFHLRQRRGVQREQSLSPCDGDDSSRPEPAAKSPPPDEDLLFAEQFQMVMESLDPEEQQLVQLKLDDHTNDQIAALWNCSERTVRRLLKRVRGKLKLQLLEMWKGER